MDQQQYMGWYKDHKAFRLVNDTKGEVEVPFSLLREHTILI